MNVSITSYEDPAYDTKVVEIEKDIQVCVDKLFENLILHERVNN